MIYKNLKWLNESQYHEIDNGIEIYAPEHTDYFVNPVNHLSLLDKEKEQML